jgi:hypothetical protein
MWVSVPILHRCRYRERCFEKKNCILVAKSKEMRRRRNVRGQEDGEERLDDGNSDEEVSSTEDSNLKSNDLDNDKVSGRLVYSTEAGLENETSKPDLEGYHLKSKERKLKDPSAVPKAGKFFLHDDRDNKHGDRGSSHGKQSSKGPPRSRKR